MNNTPTTLNDLRQLMAEDDFLTEISAASGLLEPAEKILEKMLTNYEPLKETKKTIVKLSRLDISIPVLILGETGTGKELVAEALHGARKGKFVPVNCGGIPSELLETEFFGCVKGAFTGATSDRIGYVQEAKGGTLFLDEIGELPKQLQSKLLRVLDSKKYRRVGSTIEEATEFRLVSATNRNNLDSSEDFRTDLYYRLAGAEILLPSLITRGQEDIKLIINSFAKNQFTADLIYGNICSSGNPLKGNVRQLLHIIKRANILT